MNDWLSFYIDWSNIANTTSLTLRVHTLLKDISTSNDFCFIRIQACSS